MSGGVRGAGAIPSPVRSARMRQTAPVLWMARDIINQFAVYSAWPNPTVSF
jgi:hypothetical protein